MKWLATDAQNSASLEVDRVSGAVTRRYTDPFGNTRGTVATWSSAHGFLNKPADSFTGLDMVGARQHDPDLGKFTSVDAVLAPSDPQQNNGYSYAHNNPVTLSDPAGTDPAPAASCNTLQCRNQSYGSNSPAAAGNTAAPKTHPKATQSCAYNDWYCNRASSAPDQDSAPQVQESALDRDIQMLEERMFEAEPWKRNLYTFILWQQEFAIKARPLVVLEAIAGGASGVKAPEESAFSDSTAAVGTLTGDELKAAANVMDRNGLTRAGRALQKHGDRSGSAFPVSSGGASARNSQGMEQVRKILDDPNRSVQMLDNVINIYGSQGTGVRYTRDGRFMGFLEP